MTTVAIVGAGLMGTATAYPLSDNGHNVRLVGTHLDRDIITSCRSRRIHPRLNRQLPASVRPFFVEEIGEALEGVDVIVSGVNSLGAHWIGDAIGPHVRPGQMIIAITKGLEATPSGDLIILPDVLRNTLPENVRDRVAIAAVGGPCIAGELAGRRPSCVTFGCRDFDAACKLAAIFHTTYYHIFPTADLVGIEYCAALKNAYTLAVGMAQGILEKAGGVDETGAHMFNLAAATFGQACTEIEQLLNLVGGSRQFAAGLPGAGDLYVTSMGGRTVRLGRLLGLGHSIDEALQIMAGETLESVYVIRQLGQALPGLTRQGLLAPGALPLMEALIDIIVAEQPAKIPLDAFFGGAWLT
ncbi:MAG: glycerol-3-phosphate dehydrogenase [Chloroflexota bacterium]|nr:glycerol-3-phosphate dehydrogenase [Chloroflexota bacterium]